MITATRRIKKKVVNSIYQYLVNKQMNTTDKKLPLLKSKSNETLGQGTDDWTIPQAVKNNPLFVDIGSGNIVEALKKLDKNIRDMKLGHLISAKIPNPLFGRSIKAGNFALWNNAGKPLLSLSPGKI